MLHLNFSDSDLTTSIAVGDVNGDGFVDLVAGNLGETTRVYLNSGTSGPAEKRFGVGRDVTADADFTTSVALADLNGDGSLDLVVG